MTIKCRIKKAIGISPSKIMAFSHPYCKLNIGCNNIKKCEKCRHFEVSKYYAYEIGKNLVEALGVNL